MARSPSQFGAALDLYRGLPPLALMWWPADFLLFRTLLFPSLGFSSIHRPSALCFPSSGIRVRIACFLPPTPLPTPPDSLRFFRGHL